MRILLTTLLVSASAVAFSQNFRLQFSLESFADANFFRYDPRQNPVMANYVQSVKDWSDLVSQDGGSKLNTEDIYKRLDPKFVMFQGRLAGNVHLASQFFRLTVGASTGRFDFRTFAWHVEAMFKYQFPDDWDRYSVEIGYARISDPSFGLTAAIRSANNTPDKLKDEMLHALKDDFFQTPISHGLKIGGYYQLKKNFDLGLSGFLDFVDRVDHARNDYVSLSLRLRLEQMDAPVGGGLKDPVFRRY